MFRCFCLKKKKSRVTPPVLYMHDQDTQTDSSLFPDELVELMKRNYELKHRFRQLCEEETAADDMRNNIVLDINKAPAPAPAPVMYRDALTQIDFFADGHEPKSDLAFHFPDDTAVLDDVMYNDEAIMQMLHLLRDQMDKLLFFLRTPLETAV